MGDDNTTIWFANWHSENIYQFVKIKPIYTTHSPIQRIEVVDSDIYGRLLILDGEIQLSSKFDSYIHESMVHPALLTHPDPRDVLIIGGGDGGSSREAIKHPVQSITVIEIDKKVIDVAKQFFPETAIGFSDRRVRIKTLDGRKFVEKCTKKFDIIINDISDPKGPAGSVFTKEFYSSAFKCLRDDGLFITHAESPDSCEEVFYRVISTLGQVFPIVRPFRIWIPCYIDFWGRVIASKKYDPYELDIQTVEKRINERKISSNWLTPELYHAMFRSLSKDVIKKLSLDWEPITDSTLPAFKRP